MLVALDTNILVKAANELSLNHISVVILLPNFTHSIVLDHEGNLLSEYLGNVGDSPLFQKWYQQMKSNNLICWRDGHLHRKIEHQLKDLGMHEHEDHVIVALALNSDKYIVTEDSDFGKGNRERAQYHRDVLTFLTNALKLLVHDACEACNYLKTPSHTKFI